MTVGTLYVIAAPSGTGKTSLVNALVSTFPLLTVSISHTTREKRPNEINGVNYHFVTLEKFKSMINNNNFLEYATIFDHLYGTSKQTVEENLTKGIDVILEIDWQGQQQIKRLFPDSVSIFILPPSLKELEKRLRLRNQDCPLIVQKRLADANETVSHLHEFDYLVINEEFNHAVEDLKIIISARRLLREHQELKHRELISDLLKPRSYEDKTV